MNRSFPGKERSNTTERMANRIYRRFVAQCDLGLDFHTSTQNRTTIYHARADLDNPEVRRLARAYATNVVLYGSGDEGRSGRRRPRTGSRPSRSRWGAHTGSSRCSSRRRWRGRERPRRVRAHARRGGPLAGVVPVDRRRQHKAVAPRRHRRTRRRDGGPYPLVYEGETICTITNHFKTEEHAIEAPSTG